MADPDPKNLDESRNVLWSHLEEERVCMLCVKGPQQHPQPMTMFADQDRATIWFIASADSDLVGAIADKARGRDVDAGLTIQTNKNAYMASLVGRVEISQDTEKLDELWDVAMAAWFEAGRADPKVRLLKFTPREASIWSSQTNPVLFGIKVMRAAMVKGANKPDVGTHEVIRSFETA